MWHAHRQHTDIERCVRARVVRCRAVSGACQAEYDGVRELLVVFPSDALQEVPEVRGGRRPAWTSGSKWTEFSGRRLTPHPNSSNSALACWRSAVSKPSVNQLYTGASSSRASVALPCCRHRRARLKAARSSQRFRLLAAGNVEGLLETGVRLPLRRPRRRSSRPPEAIDFRFLPAFLPFLISVWASASACSPPLGAPCRRRSAKRGPKGA